VLARRLSQKLKKCFLNTVKAKGGGLTMELIYGYAGRILHVDLTKLDIREEKLDVDFCRDYIGGAGFTGYYMLTSMNEGIDPYSPESSICIATGPLSGLSLIHISEPTRPY